MSRVELLRRSRLAMGAILVALAAALTGACGGGTEEKETTEVRVNEEGVTVTEKVKTTENINPEEGKTEIAIEKKVEGEK